VSSGATLTGLGGSSTAELLAYKNGSANIRLAAEKESGTVHISGSAIIDLVKGDYIDIRLGNASGATVTVNATSTRNHVSICKIN